MRLPRFPTTRSSLPPGSPRRAALIRAAAALFAALVLLVLGLLDGPAPSSPGVGESARGMAAGGVVPTAPVATLGAPLAIGKLGVASPAPKLEGAPSVIGAGQEGTPPALAPSCPAALPTPAPPCVPSPVPTAKSDGVLLPHAAASPAGPGYLVQLGVFSTPDNALRAYQEAAAVGLPAHIQSRVVLGPFSRREAAEQARRRLQATGAGPGVLIPPERSR